MPKTPRRNLVPSIAERMRERIFVAPPGERIGALTDLAREFDVGIVTVQQVARILEHEGLLDVRRGPGGGYFGRRPDAASLERSLAAWLRAHPDSYAEALDITSLLYIEFCGAAARNTDPEMRAELEALLRHLGECMNADDMGAFEASLLDVLFRMVNRPIFELLTRVNLRFAAASGTYLHQSSVYEGAGGIDRWAEGRRRIIGAIIAGDEPLARFEAHRGTRQVILKALRGREAEWAPPQPH